jgi:hypothetical protein
MKLSFLFMAVYAFLSLHHLNAQNYTRAEILNKDEKVQKRILESPDLNVTDLVSADWQQRKSLAGAEVRVISDSIFYRTGSTRKSHILQFPERYVVIPDAYFERPVHLKKQ